MEVVYFCLSYYILIVSSSNVQTPFKTSSFPNPLIATTRARAPFRRPHLLPCCWAGPSHRRRRAAAQARAARIAKTPCAGARRL